MPLAQVGASTMMTISVSASRIRLPVVED